MPHVRARDERVDERARSVDAKLLWSVALPVAAAYAWLVVTEQGVVWPDEIYQSIEQAHRLVFGFGYLPWEFHVGARSWAFPGLLAGPLALAKVVGLDGVRAPVLVARSVMAAVSLGGLAMSMRFAGAVSGRRAALAAGMLGACFPLSLLFATRCMSEMASAPCLLGALLLAFAPGASLRRAALGGMLAALACVFRFQNGIVAAGVGVLVFVRRPRAEGLAYAGGALVVAALGALLDTLTWGGPFHSLATYVEFNLMSDKASAFGVASPSFYLTALGRSTGLALLFVAVGLAFAARKQLGLVVVVITYVVLHSLVAHKELRFLMPVVPVALALTGAGLADAGDWLASRVGSGRARALLWSAVGVASLAMLHRAATLTRADIGYRAQPGVSAWHHLEDYNRLLWEAGAREDMCGLLVSGAQPVRIGGYSYLRRNVPLLGESPLLHSDDEAINYLIAPAEMPEPTGFTAVTQRGQHRLLRREGSCASMPQGWVPYFPP
jgi:hypothetical protein